MLSIPLILAAFVIVGIQTWQTDVNGSPYLAQSDLNAVKKSICCCPCLCDDKIQANSSETHNKPSSDPDDYTYKRSQKLGRMNENLATLSRMYPQRYYSTRFVLPDEY